MDSSKAHSELTATPPSKGFVCWFTGLSGAGKSAIANALAPILRERGLRIERLDGDILRKSLTADLGFSEDDRNKNIRRATFVAKLLSRNNVGVLASFISPYRKIRQYVRDEVVNMVEVFVKCPLEICIERDVKMMYKRAIAGEIKDFTGISHPYEEPDHEKCEVIVETDKETLEESVRKVLTKLEEMGLVPHA